jgi:cysteine sulfinate desulfinase/cysteine desulfurase-like protein
VLLAMGMPMEDALGSLRLTVGYQTTGGEVEEAVDVLRSVLATDG